MPAASRKARDTAAPTEPLPIVAEGIPRSIGEIAGRGEREDALIALGEERPFEEAAALVVQEIFVPVIFHQLRDDHHDAAVRIFLGQLQHILHHRNDYQAVGRRE